ncbi:MAG: insulinase family protein [Prevotella sp.]|nr:insulinase family protein [Prevotella sp.]
MKKLSLSLSAALLSAALFAQPSVLQVKELQLSNGMTVWLNEDHSQPKVYGSVVVRAGAKDCPDTGIAHYFEHIMFKGTDQIGTVDYEAERPWLDSIAAQYDLLSQTKDEQQRAGIQRHINALSLQAANYAIPNEFSRLISKYGGTGLNAGTGPDKTVYYNQFLPQYIEQWCWLNSERLIHPVFRGFQGELENVYEEKNRSSDNLGGALDKALKAVFKEQPYAYPVLGSTENLKNPRLSDMQAFYKQYYVASNMCLMLVGDITPSEKLISLLEQTFGRVQTGTVPVRRTSPMPAITAGERTSIKLPIPLIGAKALVFKTPTAFEEDAPALELARQLLSNEEAGMLDSLVNEHVVMMAGMMGIDYLADAALDALYIIPKIPFGKMKKAEAACLQQVRRLMDGDFTDVQLETIKRQLLMEAELGLETIDMRAEHMIDVYSRGYSWQQYLEQIEACRKVTKADVMRVARKYYGDNYLTLVKKYGSDKKETLLQPGYTPLKARNAGAKSAFAQWLETRPKGSQAIRLVDMDNDVVHTILNEHATLYSKENPVNDIFTLALRYHSGTREKPMLTQLANYLSTIGTDSLRKQQLASAWQQLGATMTIDSGDERFAFRITARDAYLEPALRLLAHFLTSAKGDDNALKALKQEAKVTDKAFGKQKDDVLIPMIDYVRYGHQSSYLKQPSLREIRQLTSEDLLSLFRELQQSDCDIVYCGTHTPADVAQLAQQILPLQQCRHRKTDTTYKLQASDEPIVYFYHVPHARQNYVCSYEQLASQPTAKGRATARLWARYTGGGMSGVLFQNIREFRSLAYTTQGDLLRSIDARHQDDPLAFITITGTQADKTMQVVDAVDSLLTQPLVWGATGGSTENLEAARQELLSSIQNSYPTFRTIGFYVANRQQEGYTSDPNAQLVEQLTSLQVEDIARYQHEQVANNHRVWIIIGDRKLTDFNALAKYGRIVELKKEDIYH